MKYTIRALGEAQVPILGMHWMPQIVWRTDMGHYGRGDSYVSVYDHSIVEDRSRDSEIWVARRDEQSPDLKDTFNSRFICTAPYQHSHTRTDVVKL